MRNRIDRLYARQRLVSRERDILRRRMAMIELAAWALAYFVVVGALLLSRLFE